MNYSISPAQAAQEILNRDLATESLKSFIEYTTPKWKAGPIHDVICEQAERIVNGEIDRLLLLCPPQHGKSELISRRLSAYILGRDPHKDIISASATATLARRVFDSLLIEHAYWRAAHRNGQPGCFIEL